MDIWVQPIAPRVLTSRASLDRSAWPRPRRIPQPCLDMGRPENGAPGPSWTVAIVAHPSPLLHTVIASGFCTALGRVIGHISPSPHNGRFLLVLRECSDTGQCASFISCEGRIGPSDWAVIRLPLMGLTTGEARFSVCSPTLSPLPNLPLSCTGTYNA